MAKDCPNPQESLERDAARWRWCEAHPQSAFEMMKVFVGKRNPGLRFAGWVDSQVAKEKER